MRETRAHEIPQKTHRPGASSAYANAAERTLDGEREPEPTRLNVTGKDTHVFLSADQERETKVKKKQAFVKPVRKKQTFVKPKFSAPNAKKREKG